MMGRVMGKLRAICRNRTFRWAKPITRDWAKSVERFSKLNTVEAGKICQHRMIPKTPQYVECLQFSCQYGNPKLLLIYSYRWPIPVFTVLLVLISL